MKINWTTTISSKVFEWSKIKFKEEKQKYTVISSNKFFLICTKPFNVQKTVLYTIVDYTNRIRWTENLVFWMWAETKEECDEMLERLTNWETEVSYRNNIPLDIEYYDFPDK